MTDIAPPPVTAAGSPFRLKTDQVFLRTTGAPLLAGNSVRILKDARENYPAWQEAMLLSITGVAAAMQSTG